MTPTSDLVLFLHGRSNNTDNFEICNSMNKVGQSKMFSVWSPAWTVCIDSCKLSFTYSYNKHNCYEILNTNVSYSWKSHHGKTIWTAALVNAAALCYLYNKGETNTTIGKFLSPGAPLIPYHNFALAILIISDLKITPGKFNLQGK